MSKADTKEKILTAGLALLEKETILQISTADICAEAGVSSRTFYNRYADKFDMAQHILLMLDDKFWQKSQPSQSSFSEQFHYYGLFVNDHRDFFRNNFCYSGQNCLYDFLIDLAYRNFCALIRKIHPEMELMPEVQMTLRFYLYGIFGLMIDFINGRTTNDQYPYGRDYLALYTPEILKPFFYIGSGTCAMSEMQAEKSSRPQNKKAGGLFAMIFTSRTNASRYG